MLADKVVANWIWEDTPLDDEERSRLSDLEAIVEKGLQTFYEVGKALEEIRERRFYRDTHKTFEAYCRDRWKMARQTANRYIGAARVMENLTPVGVKIPTSERQVRPLTGLEPTQQLEIWQEAVELAPNGIPTGALVKRLVDRKVKGRQTDPDNSTTEVNRLRRENQQLKERIARQERERERRAAEVATELERLRAENAQLRAELRQRDLDWQRREAWWKRREAELLKENAELKAKYNNVLDRLEALERKTQHLI